MSERFNRQVVEADAGVPVIESEVVMSRPRERLVVLQRVHQHIVNVPLKGLAVLSLDAKLVSSFHLHGL